MALDIYWTKWYHFCENISEIDGMRGYISFTTMRLTNDVVAANGENTGDYDVLDGRRWGPPCRKWAPPTAGHFQVQSPRSGPDRADEITPEGTLPPLSTNHIEDYKTTTCSWDIVIHINVQDTFLRVMSHARQLMCRLMNEQREHQ